MPAPWVAGAQVRIIGELHGQETVNVMHFATNDQVNDEGTLDSILLALAEAVRDCVISTLLPGVTSDWRFVRTEALRVYPTRTDPIVATGTPDNVGELSSTSVSFAASLINIRSGRGGRSGRGRIFLPPPGESEVQNSLVDNATLVLLAAFAGCVATKFMGANPTTPWHLGILSRKIAGATNSAFDNGFFIATSLNPSADVACMRSRRRGHGA
jgi:hypothetical protein